jgi:hypothetical protein
VGDARLEACFALRQRKDTMLSHGRCPGDEPSALYRLTV